MAEFAEEFHEILRAEWEPRGFQHIRSFRWVEQTQGPIRRMFDFQAFGSGGHTRSARWGFSLDFVPKFRGRQLRWKRTAKSAEMDITIGPAQIGAPADLFEFFYIPGYHERPSKSWLGRAVAYTAQAAHRDLARVKTAEDTVRMFEEFNQLSHGGLTLENYVQTHIAWGLALVATGKQAEGQSHILRFCKQFDVEWGHPILLKAEAEALRLAGGASS